MEYPAASRRVYHFDELLSSFWNWKLLHRQSAQGKIKVTQTKRLVAAAVLNSLQVTFLSIKISQYLRCQTIDWDIVLEATALLLPVTNPVLQGISHILKRRFIEKLMANLDKLFPQTRADQWDYNLRPYANHLIRHINFIDKVLRWAIVVIATMPLLFSLYEWLLLGREFPFYFQFRSWYPVNSQSWVFYPFLYIFQIAICFFCAFNLFNDYALYSMVTSQMLMHYRNLGRMMSELDALKEETKKCSTLRRLVDYHSALDELCDNTNEVFSMTTFVSFGFTKLSICMVVYTFLHGKNLIVLPTLVVTFVFLVLSAFIRCSKGTALYTASKELINKIYESNWYEGSPRYRRMLAFMMARANNPIELHALKITKIRMETFKELSTEAYQIFTFLLKFRSS